MDKIQKIKEEIERLISIEEETSHLDKLSFNSGRWKALTQVKVFIDSLPEEPASEELKKEINTLFSDWLIDLDEHKDFVQIARHFAEWQKQKDEKLFKEGTWNYIEEQYPDVIKEEKLRLYDISIKSRLAGANAIKQQMKEALQTEYEKGRFDMQQEIMKDTVEGTVKYEIGSAEIPQCDRRYQVLSDPVPITNAKLGDKVKIIIIKTDQQ